MKNVKLNVPVDFYLFKYIANLIRTYITKHFKLQIYSGRRTERLRYE